MIIYTIQDLLFFIRNGCDINNKDISQKMKNTIKEFQSLIDCAANCEGSEQEQYVKEALELYDKNCIEKR